MAMALLHRSEPQLLRTLRQDYRKFKASLCELAKPYLNPPKTNNKQPKTRPKRTQGKTATYGPTGKFKNQAVRHTLGGGNSRAGKRPRGQVRLRQHLVKELPTSFLQLARGGEAPGGRSSTKDFIHPPTCPGLPLPQH